MLVWSMNSNSIIYKVRKEYLMVAFIDMEKAYDRVNRKKLFEVMRGYGVQGILVDVIDKIYD